MADRLGPAELGCGDLLFSIYLQFYPTGYRLKENSSAREERKKNVEETKKVVVDFGQRGKCLERNLEEYDKGGGLQAGKLVNQYN